MKNILLTGSSGFVGSYFTDNYTKKYYINKFSFLNDNFDELSLSNTDTIIHLSALVHQMGGASEEEYKKVNVTQTIDLAKKAKERGVKHFIFMSTVKVYGEEIDIAYTENTTCSPQDDYGKSKLEAELELQKLEDDDFKVSIIRTPIVYGYGVKANIKNLISLVSKVPVLPFASIQNKRSMIYVGNLCYMIDTLIGMTNRLDCFVPRNDGGSCTMTDGLDCHASLAMTGETEEGVRLPRFARNDGKVARNDGDEMTRGNIFLASDDEPLSTTRLIELIANGLGKKVYLVKIPFFESLLKLVKPSFHKRLYESLEVDNSHSMKRLFGEDKSSLPFSVEDGIKFMLNDKDK